MTARNEALYLNGVFESVLEEILKTQALLPEQIMFLQPYSGNAITHLRETAPSVDDPMLLVVSTSKDREHVCYAAEIVGWEDKTALSTDKWRLINRLVVTLQPQESGLYDASKSPDKQSLNLLFIRRTIRIRRAAVTTLMNAKDGTKLAGNRSTSGGWVYVEAASLPRDARALAAPRRGV